MDYIRLKKTLIAVFDHFLSCHDTAELEEMMQAFEVGKSLVIKLPEPVDREDYAQNVVAMTVPEPKKTISRIRRKKPKPAVKTDMTQIKICDVSVLLDLKNLSKEKREALREAVKGEHSVTLHNFEVSDMHGFAKARIFKRVEAQDAVSSCDILRCAQNDSPFSFGKTQEKASDQILRANLIEKIMFEIKKAKDPP